MILQPPNVKWPIRPPSEIKDPVIASLIQAFARKEKPNPEEIISTSKKVYNYLPKPKDADAAFQAALDFTSTVNNCFVRAKGATKDSHYGERLEACVELLILNDLANDLDSLRASREKVLSLESQLPPQEGSSGWFNIKVHKYRMFLENKIGTLYMANSLSIPDGQNAWNDMLSLIKGTDAIANIMGNLNELRRYGVKSSYFQDNKTHAPGETWLFMDHLMFKNAAPNLFYPANPIAAIMLAKKSEILSKKSVRIDTISGTHLNAFGELIPSVKLNIDGRQLWSIDKNGVLDATEGIGLLPVKKIFEDAGKEREYHIIQALHVLRLYDLVVPLSIVSQNPSLRPEKNLASRLIDRVAGRPEGIIEPQIILPRLKTLDDRKLMEYELEREIELAEKDTIERSNREMRRHEVIDHVRRLPAGYHPSQTAIKAAAEIGIKLGQNETLVKKHYRGNLEKEGIVHKGVIRQRKR